MNFKRILFLAFVTNFCLAQELVIERATQIFEVSLEDLDKIVTDKNINVDNLKLEKSNNYIEFNGNANNSIIKNNTFVYSSDFANNKIKAHNDLVDVMKENINSTSLETKSKDKVQYFLNLIKLDDEGNK